METWKKVAIAGGGGVGTLLLGAESIRRRLVPDKPANVVLDGTTVEIHVMTLNEEGWIEGCLRSLREQNLYRTSENVKIVVADSHSTDCTVEKARELADEVITVPRGKLSARDTAIRSSSADIIVSTDADCQFPQYWLGHLLKPYQNTAVVATHGPKLSLGSTWSHLRAWSSGLGFYRRIITASNSSFKRQAYIQTGGFDLSVDQYDRGGELNEEEENRFLDKLKRVGNVVYVPVAVKTSERQLPLSELLDGEEIKKYKEEIKAGVRF